MSRKSIPVSNLGKLQLELLDCVGIVKDEISNVLVLLQQFIDDSGPEVDYDKLEILFKKMQKAALECRGVQDYILEIDRPERKL